MGHKVVCSMLKVKWHRIISPKLDKNTKLTFLLLFSIWWGKNKFTKEDYYVLPLFDKSSIVKKIISI